MLQSPVTTEVLKVERKDGDVTFDVTVAKLESPGWLVCLEDLKGSLWEFKPEKYTQEQLDNLLFFEEGTNIAFPNLDKNERYAVTFASGMDSEAHVNLSAEEVIDLFDTYVDSPVYYKKQELNIYPMSLAKDYKEMLQYAV